ncbi:MAG: aldolase/citrate lyase family protein, partial [Actinobacteria bacterium]|nr:aldolase/citrate lyase family protein [Actinomycetota bacterium]
PYVRAAGYSSRGSYFADANAGAAVLAMVEGRSALDGLDDILQVDGIDSLFVGPVDLSASLGVPGETEHPIVLGTAESVIRRASAAGVATAIFAGDAKAGAKWLSMGVRFIALSVDAGMILEGFRTYRAALPVGHGRPPSRRRSHTR